MPTVTYATPLQVKLAAGDVQSFEDSLAAIGRSYLAPKAPRLFEHEIGFQVLDQDDDNTRAVGVFGFRIGRRVMYVPMFYRSGTIKGTEQLRDPKGKRAVPLSDNWVNKILSERGDDPPERIDASESRDTSQPSMWQLKYPPTKYAAADAAAFRELVTLAKRDLARIVTGPVPDVTKAAGAADPDADLIKVAAQHPELLARLGTLAVRYAWFGEALDRYHGRAKLAAALEAVKAAAFAPRGLTAAGPLVAGPAKKADSLTVIRIRAVNLGKGPNSLGLDFRPDDLAELRAGRNAYDDRRADADVGRVHWVGGESDEGPCLSNPTQSGYYEVLGADFKYHHCVVLCNLVGWRPRSEERVVVVRPADGAWTYAHRNAVWVRGMEDTLVPDVTSGQHGKLYAWAKDLPVLGDRTKLPEGRHVVVNVVGPRQIVATVPVSSWGDGCECSDSCGTGDRPFWAPLNPRLEWPEHYADHRAPKAYATKKVRVFPDPGHSYPVVSGTSLFVPAESRLLRLDGPQLELGEGSDPERALFMTHKSAGETIVAVRRGASGWHLEATDGPAVKTAYAEDAEALLASGFRLRVADARRLVAAAEKTPGRAARAGVKYADSLSTKFPVSPHLPFDEVGRQVSFADDILPSEGAGFATVPIQDMLPLQNQADRNRAYPVDYGTERPLPGIGNSGDHSRDNPPLPKSDLQHIADAAASGRRELFDTSALASLVKYTRLPTLLERVRTRMARMTTDLADLLAHCYWNTQEWADQYGQTEVGPLEDQIRAQFEGLGELGLTLQEKSVESHLDTGILPDAQPSDGGD